MARVIQPQKRDSGLGTLLSLGKIGAGVATGQPLVAAGGAVEVAQSQESQGANLVPGGDGKLDALKRRGDALAQDPFESLQRAQGALQNTSPEFQARVQPVIEQALARAKQQRGG